MYSFIKPFSWCSNTIDCFSFYCAVQVICNGPITTLDLHYWKEFFFFMKGPCHDTWRCQKTEAAYLLFIFIHCSLFPKSVLVSQICALESKQKNIYIYPNDKYSEIWSLVSQGPCEYDDKKNLKRCFFKIRYFILKTSITHPRDSLCVWRRRGFFGILHSNVMAYEGIHQHVSKVMVFFYFFIYFLDDRLQHPQGRKWEAWQRMWCGHVSSTHWPRSVCLSLLLFLCYCCMCF